MILDGEFKAAGWRCTRDDTETVCFSALGVEFGYGHIFCTKWILHTKNDCILDYLDVDSAQYDYLNKRI